MARKKESNKIVIAKSPNRRPYGAKLCFLVEDHIDFSLHAETSLIIASDIIIKIKPSKNETNPGFHKWELFVDAFSTAGEAEGFGLKVAFGLLWSAVKHGYAARLIYSTPLPCIVYDRTPKPGSTGLYASTTATLNFTYKVEGLTVPLDEILSITHPLNPNLLVAIELFTSAKLETTERSKFVSLVSAIEPLAKQFKYEDEALTGLIKEFKLQAKNSQISPKIKDSIIGRLDQLKIESVSQAIRRLIKDRLPEDQESLDIIEEAYSLRSKILHEGATDADLSLKSHEVETVLKKLISEYVADLKSPAT